MLAGEQLGDSAESCQSLWKFVATLWHACAGPAPIRPVGGVKRQRGPPEIAQKNFRPETGTGSGRTRPAGPGEPNPRPTNRSADRAYDTIVP